jgi:hypothetical protein
MTAGRNRGALTLPALASKFTNLAESARSVTARCVRRFRGLLPKALCCLSLRKASNPRWYCCDSRNATRGMFDEDATPVVPLLRREIHSGRSLTTAISQPLSSCGQSQHDARFHVAPASAIAGFSQGRFWDHCRRVRRANATAPIKTLASAWLAQNAINHVPRHAEPARGLAHIIAGLGKRRQHLGALQFMQVVFERIAAELITREPLAANRCGLFRSER